MNSKYSLADIEKAVVKAATGTKFSTTASRARSRSPEEMKKIEQDLWMADGAHRAALKLNWNKTVRERRRNKTHEALDQMSKYRRKFATAKQFLLL